MNGSATITTPSEREIRVERIFNAPRERVWQAMTDPELVTQWWGRGNKVVIERMEVERGGHWRFVEHGPDGVHGFEGRYREVVPPERVVQTCEWDGMPGHVIIETSTLEDLGDGRTRLVLLSLFSAPAERDRMLQSGMEQGMNQSHAALDALLAKGVTAAGRRPEALRVRKVAFTMYPVADIARARAFYEGLLGLAVGMHGNHGDKHWVEYDLPRGGCFALTNATGDAPSDTAGGTVAFEVNDLDALIQHLKSKGVPFKTDVVRGPRCRMAVCLDPEGNSILLHQLDKEG